MMKYNSKIFARSICAVMAGIMMVGGLTGCGNDDAVDGRGMRLEKQNGDNTEITGIAEKYREKESKQKKKSLQDNGLSGIFNSTSNDVMYAEEACDVATVAGDTAMVTDTSNSMFDISLDSVGEILHISPAYLSAQFKKYQKMNFLDCLTELRINAAKELLNDPFRSSAEVASMVGYEDASYFARAFKKRTGVTPTQYRKQAAKAAKDQQEAAL